jgi:hypothetical protein
MLLARDGAERDGESGKAIDIRFARKAPHFRHIEFRHFGHGLSIFCFWPLIGKTCSLQLPLIFVFEVLESVGRIAEPDFRDEIADLLMIGRQIEMDLEAFEERVGDNSDLVGRHNFGIEEIPYHLSHFSDAGGTVVGEIEENEKFAVEKARRLKGRRRL